MSPGIAVKFGVRIDDVVDTGVTYEGVTCDGVTLAQS
jgi:hypothetical protein